MPRPQRHPRVGVAVLAAGSSRRMGGTDKLFAPLAGKPLLAHCLEAFEASPRVDTIAIAAAPRSMERVRHLVGERRFTRVSRIVEGGARRQDSVANALDALEGVGIVLIHDGARPFVDESLISNAVDAALEWGAAAAAIPAQDTIKVAAPDMTVASTPPRDTLWAAQTPQAFGADLIRRAHNEITHEATDDAAMVEALGCPVRLFLGARYNIKVTAPEDLIMAEAIARARMLGCP